MARAASAIDEDRAERGFEGVGNGEFLEAVVVREFGGGL